MSFDSRNRNEWSDDRFETALFRLFAALMRRSTSPPLPSNDDTMVTLAKRRDHGVEMYTRSVLAYLIILLYVIGFAIEAFEGWTRVVALLFSPVAPLIYWTVAAVGTGLLFDLIEKLGIRLTGSRKRTSTTVQNLLLTAFALVGLRSNLPAQIAATAWLTIVAANLLALLVVRFAIERDQR